MTVSLSYSNPLRIQGSLDCVGPQGQWKQGVTNCRCSLHYLFRFSSLRLRIFLSDSSRYTIGWIFSDASYFGCKVFWASVVHYLSDSLLDINVFGHYGFLVPNNELWYLQCFSESNGFRQMTDTVNQISMPFILPSGCQIPTNTSLMSCFKSLVRLFWVYCYSNR